MGSAQYGENNALKCGFNIENLNLGITTLPVCARVARARNRARM